VILELICGDVYGAQVLARRHRLTAEDGPGVVADRQGRREGRERGGHMNVAVAKASVPVILRNAAGEPPLGSAGAFFRDDQGEMFVHPKRKPIARRQPGSEFLNSTTAMAGAAAVVPCRTAAV
jgi:hypothetical protein